MLFRRKIIFQPGLGHPKHQQEFHQKQTDILLHNSRFVQSLHCAILSYNKNYTYFRGKNVVQAENHFLMPPEQRYKIADSIQTEDDFGWRGNFYRDYDILAPPQPARNLKG